MPTEAAASAVHAVSAAPAVDDAHAAPAVPADAPTGTPDASNAQHRLITHLQSMARARKGARFGVALSGGCDSACLTAAMACAGLDAKAYIAKTAFQPERDIADALKAARVAGLPAEIIELDVFAHPDICANPPDRCYLCKRLIFGSIRRAIAADGRHILCDGTNLDDDPARRPGFRALAELDVRSPLREAGMTKADVREAGRALGAVAADKPSFSCWATHVPEGQPLTPASIAAARDAMLPHAAEEPATSEAAHETPCAKPE